MAARGVFWCSGNDRRRAVNCFRDEMSAAVLRGARKSVKARTASAAKFVRVGSRFFILFMFEFG